VEEDGWCVEVQFCGGELRVFHDCVWEDSLCRSVRCLDVFGYFREGLPDWEEKDGVVWQISFTGRSPVCN
jgi:hypothetical protein